MKSCRGTELKSKKGISARKRSYYSELVSGAGDEIKCGASGSPQLRQQQQQQQQQQHRTSELIPSQPKIAARDVMSTWRSFGSNRSTYLGSSSMNINAAAGAVPVVERERWISFKQDPSIVFAGESFTPKVQMQVEAEPRHLVRNVETERRRRMYKSFKLDELFQKEGIKSPEELVAGHYLRLDVFDDEEYDCRTPSEWLSLGLVDGKQYPLPAEAPLGDGEQIRWQTVAVTHYHENTKLWQFFTLDASRQVFHLPRIFVRFYAEDPRIFVRRVVAALRERKKADASLKYNLKLDCMTYDGIETLDDQQKKQIILLTERQTEEYSGPHESGFILELMKEVERNYQRVMCDFECQPLICHRLDSSSRKDDDSNKTSKILRVSPAEAKIKNYLGIKDYLQWNGLYVYGQVFDAMVTIVDECNRVAERKLFHVRYGKTLRIDEFNETQLHTIHSCVAGLKERWVENIERSVRMCLRDLGKGNYDLKQKKYDVYEGTKLKRFMELIMQHMQTALRTLIESSSLAYVGYLETPTLNIPSLDRDFSWHESLRNSGRFHSNKPIFQIEIDVNERSAFYTTDPNLFPEKLISLYVNALLLCQKIRQVHPSLLENLKFAKDLHIKSVNTGEPLPSQVCKRLQIAYHISVVPLRAYVKMYDRYCSLFALDPVKYAENYKNEEHTAYELKDEISSQYALKSSLEADVPERIIIGAFEVSVEKLKKLLTNKRQKIIDCLLDSHTNYLREQIEEIIESLRYIYSKLAVEPSNVEQLYEMREWMETVPMLVSEQVERMQTLKVEYDVLDAFLRNLSDEDFQAKVEALRLPGLILTRVEETQETLAELEKETFYKLQLDDENTIAERIETLNAIVTNIMMQADLSKVQEIALEVKKTWKLLKETEEFGILLNARQKLFGVPVRPFRSLTKLLKTFEPYKQFWLACAEWHKWYGVWMKEPLKEIDGSEIEGIVADWYKIAARCVKVFQDQPDLSALANDTKDQIDHFKPYVGVIQALRNPGMKARHLDQISEILGIDIVGSPELTFTDLLACDVLKFEENIKDISEGAAKEHAIEEALNKMISDWATSSMEVLPYKDSGLNIMKVTDELQILLDDHILNTQQLSFSQFKAAFEEEIDEWYSKLCLARDVIILWMEVQKIWMYLEPIFSSEDISRQLPVEAKKYSAMERNWRRILKQASDNPIIMKLCPDRTLLESLRECMSLLEVVQKGLSDYLESRRLVFPRFFFLSDDELLEILAQAKEPRAVQPHLKKCIESLKELLFVTDARGATRITRMYSVDGEEVALEPALEPRGGVEYWLGDLENTMRISLRRIISRALASVERQPRRQWIFRWPGQVSLCVGQASWTGHVERAIGSSSLSDYFGVAIKQLDELRDLVRQPRTDIERLMLEAIITIEVHARDVLQQLIDEKVRDVNDFNWISQLRYYWLPSDAPDNDVHGELKIRAVNAEFQYGYEYLGNNGRLVITPLTDRCYLTLTGALHLKFGGAPAGPAGTGKTETTKDLAKALAIQCVVFNCSDQLDYMSMGKFFKGLASSGAWACFDEFNRIDVEVLSVIAQQVMTIQKAQQINADRFIFEGIELKLRGSCAVFITMNPGYAGRTELPDNLKALFRPVAMMVPNYALIAEISLFSCGFGEAKALATKITATFKLSSEQLSSQDHYDFGMRSVKTVIAVAGILKREQKDMEEQQICLRALRDVNVPKFLRDDLKLFNGIVSDLFPQVEEKQMDYTMLVEAVRRAINDMGLADVPAFIQKVIQLYETTIVRHGLMLVGATGSGKTKCYQVLQKAFSKLKGKDQPSGKPFCPVLTYSVNPKSITMGQLYGEFDLNTHEWTDGIFSSLLRAGSDATDNFKRWYIFDGPVDAVWIENMNTVLDDNKKLCLTSGEIIRLTPAQTMIFEVEDLKVASPATVSRCGMVYFEPQDLGVEPLINCWIRTIPEHMTKHVNQISELAHNMLLPALKFLREELREIVVSTDSGVSQAFINLMNCQIESVKNWEDRSLFGQLIEPWTAFALVWSVGATCDGDGRYLFSDWLRDFQKKANHDMHFPAEGLAYDYRLIVREGSDTNPIEWLKWLDNKAPVSISMDAKFSDIEIPTVDMERTSVLIDYLLLNDCNVLCIGPSGSGKTLTISTKLSRDMPKKFICDFIIFSARTSANQTQDLIDSKLDKRRRGVYGPPMSKRQIFFIDDLNMPALETYGAQPPIELLRQYMDFKGWYDRKEIGDFRKIEDVNFVCAMAPPGGGRNPVTARLLRHFHFIVFPEMEDDTKKIIFGTILSSWLAKAAFMEEFVEPIMTASLHIFRTLCKELLPTPDKCHYTFNVRDLGKVFQGMLMADSSQLHSLDDLLLLWYHENFRVFRDRLINNKDRNWFERLMQNILKETLDYDIRQVVKDEILFYGNFCNTDSQYERIRNIKEMENTMIELLEDYNSTTTVPINLVLFEDAMSHVCRITRILNQSPGNALLLGMGGSGRQSLTKLSSHIAENSCFQIELTKAYSVRDWREDIKDLLLKTGVHKKPQVFLFSDVQIKYNLFLEDINNILSSGDVPNIYQSDEINTIFQAMRNIVQESGLQINRSNLLAAYQKVIRNNLHTVITMTPIGELFRSRIRQFPALVNLCTIDWFDPWPDSALRSVAFHFLKNTADEAITQDVLKSIVDVCQFMHTSVIKASEDLLQEFNRHNYVTPTSYLELLSSYGDLLDRKKKELYAGINRLSTGLEKLASTEVEVKEMQIILEKMKPQLERATIISSKMIEEIGRDTAEAEKARALASEQEKEALKLQRENEAIKDDAEADLNTVRPMLAAAEASLKALNKNDITEVKAMKRPPPGVVLVIEGICIVKKVKPNKVAGERPGEKLNDYWTPGSQMLADAGQFLASLENYNKEDITEEIIDKLRPYIENPNFAPKKIMKVSKACHSLCMWLHAMYNYYFVSERVKPKMAALEKAKAELAETQAALDAAMAKLQKIQAGLDALQVRFRVEEDKKRELEAQKQLCEERMSRAVRLTSGLADESKRWRATVAEAKLALGKLVGDILLCAGSIAYLTPFVDSYRKRLLASWLEALEAGVPHTPDCGPVKVLGDPVEIRQWHIDGLPRDSLSIENAVLLMNSRRWPLLIDPQAQANRWLRNTGNRSAAGLSTVRMTDKDLLRVVENCVRFGRTCLIENVGLELEAALDTVLMRSLFRQAGQLCIKIGDNIVPYSPDFRLYLTTKLPNPHYAPEVAVKVLIVNFSLTASGLADQMLSLVIMQERPDLEETRSSLLVASAQMRYELQHIEDRILTRLSLSEGSAVDDIDLINTLEASKVKSEEIKLKVESAELAQASIDAARSLYVPVAERAQVLFFCLLDLQLIDTMYQYSLEWFIRIFTNSMLNTEKNDDVNIRVQSINEFFTFALYSNVCQSLFEKHKLHFAFLLCIRIQMMDDSIDRNEWKFLLSGAIAPRKEANPAPEWLTQRCWDEIQSLQVLPKFQQFTDSFRYLIAKFKYIFDAQQPETTALPKPWNDQLNDLQKLLVLKCLRPDKVMNAIQIYVSKHLGNRFVEPQASGLDAIFKETSPTTPFVFILSSGTDPASELYKFAEKLKMARKLYSVSLGQGQGPRAELMLKQSIEAGNWIFFQNCHLAPSWMPTLELLVERLPPEGIHRDFRLWLTSMPSKFFPVSILQNGCKLTMEPPRGVKANMLRTYGTQVIEMQDFFESEHAKVEIFKTLIFSLGLFHAILLERRKFGPLGFNIPYEFTDGDFVICMSQLRMFLLEYLEVPFKVLIYTAGHINYGGRITDDWDRRCVLTILKTFYDARVLSPGHQFDTEGHYVQPALDTSLAEYIGLIKRLPINDDPSLFGLHANANISYAQAETYACLESLETLQPRDIASGAKGAAEEGLSQLVQHILRGLPEPFDLAAIQRKYPVLYEESLNTVLVQEATRYNGLIKEMASSLKDLASALKGIVVMSEKLETMSLALSSNKVPENWQNKAFASLKPLGAWVEDLKMRMKFIKEWQEGGIPAAFWISGFYFPQALLTGTLQNYARKYGVAIDSIDFAFKVLTSKPDKRPENGCVVYGLFVEGCRWDSENGHLAESMPRELFTEMAPVLFLPESAHKKADDGIYECPVYKTVKRAGTLSTTGHSTNFILSMEIPSKEPQAHWIVRGVALICSLDF